MHPWHGKGGKGPDGGPPRHHGHHGGPHGHHGHHGPPPGGPPGGWPPGGPPGGWPPGPPPGHHERWAHHHQRREEERNRMREEITQQMNQQMQQTLNQKMAELTQQMLQQQQKQQSQITDAMMQQMNQNKQVTPPPVQAPIPPPVQTPPPPPVQTPSPIVQSQTTVQPPSITDSSIQKSQILESQIIESTSEILKIQEIKPTPETHKIIMIHLDQFQFPIIPYNEKYEDELHLKNSEIQGYMIGQIKREFPHYETYDLCQAHGTQIEYVCLEEQCRLKNKYLMCPKCVKYHKQHDFQEISETIYFGKQRMEQFDQTNYLIGKMEGETASKLKYLRSKGIQDLECVEKKFTEGFNELKAQLEGQKGLYNAIMAKVKEGGLCNLAESIGLIIAEQHPSPNNLQSSLYLKGFISKLEQAEAELKQYEHLVMDIITNIKTIKVDNHEFEVDFQKVITHQDLYQQIKILLIKEDLQNLIYRELVWLNENSAIKLQQNNSEIDQNQVKNVQIVSYQPF